MADELKPCPFCEQQAEVGRYGNPRLSTIIECTNCGSRVESSDQYPDHARSWNHRPIEDALCAEVAEKNREVAIAIEMVETANKQVKALQEDNNALKDMLRKYTGPLTHAEVTHIFKAYAGELLPDEIEGVDEESRAIRAAREGDGK